MSSCVLNLSMSTCALKPNMSTYVLNSSTGIHALKYSSSDNIKYISPAYLSKQMDLFQFIRGHLGASSWQLAEDIGCGHKAGSHCGSPGLRIGVQCRLGLLKIEM